MSSRTLCAASALISSALAIPSRPLSLVPSFSAYAETIGTNEIPVNRKVAYRELVLLLLDPVHRLVVQAEIVAHLMDHHVADEIRHLLGVRAVFLDGTLVDMDRVREHVAVGGVAAGDVDPPVEPIEGIGGLDAHLLEGQVVGPVLDHDGDVGEPVAEGARQTAEGGIDEGFELPAGHG